MKYIDNIELVLNGPLTNPTAGGSLGLAETRTTHVHERNINLKIKLKPHRHPNVANNLHLII